MSALGPIGLPEALAALREPADDPFPEIREAGAQELGARAGERPAQPAPTIARSSAGSG
ncbi:MAG: hypothetical protein ACR2GE_11755 [Pseudonocardia sp.]